MHVIMHLQHFLTERFDWLVVIDVDLYTKPTHIWQLIEVLQHDRFLLSWLVPVLFKYARYFRPWPLELLR